MKRTLWMGTALAGMALAGCGGEDPIDRFAAVGVRTVDVFCECPTAVGEVDEASCRAELDDLILTSAQERCLRGVYDEHQAELGPSLDCVLDASEALIDCAERALRICPPIAEEMRACNERYEAESGACPRPSSSVNARVGACLAL